MHNMQQHGVHHMRVVRITAFGVWQHIFPEWQVPLVKVVLLAAWQREDDGVHIIVDRQAVVLHLVSGYVPLSMHIYGPERLAGPLQQMSLRVLR